MAAYRQVYDSRRQQADCQEPGSAPEPYARGQLDGIFLAGSLPHEFIILIVTLFICLWLINFSFSLSVIEYGLPF